MSGLESLYQEIIVDHSRARHGEGTLEGPHFSHHELNPTCGDEITVRVRLAPSAERSAALAWQGQGCSISMASETVLTELGAGAKVEDALELAGAFREMLRSKGEGEPDEDLLGDAIAFHGVSKYVMRVKCAMLSWVALEAAVGQARAAD